MIRPCKSQLALVLLLGLGACETTRVSEQLDSHEMQGVRFTTERQEDVFLGMPVIVHTAYNSHPFPVCAGVEGFDQVVVPAGRSMVIATQPSNTRSASFAVGPVASRGGC